MNLSNKYLLLACAISAAGTVFGAEKLKESGSKILPGEEYVDLINGLDKDEVFQAGFKQFIANVNDPQQAALDVFNGMKKIDVFEKKIRKDAKRDEKVSNKTKICSIWDLCDGSEPYSYKKLDLAIKHTGSLKVTNPKGYTPLLWAIEKSGNISIVEQLLDNGSDITEMVAGKGIVKLAEETFHHELADNLKRRIKAAKEKAKRQRQKQRQAEKKKQENTANTAEVATTATAAAAQAVVNAIKPQQKTKKQLEQERNERAAKAAEQQRVAAAVLAAQKAEAKRLAQIAYEQEREATRLRLEKEESDNAAVKQRLDDLVGDIEASNTRYQKNLDTTAESLSTGAITAMRQELAQEENTRLKINAVAQDAVNAALAQSRAELACEKNERHKKLEEARKAEKERHQKEVAAREQAEKQRLLDQKIAAHNDAKKMDEVLQVARQKTAAKIAQQQRMQQQQVPSYVVPVVPGHQVYQPTTPLGFAVASHDINSVTALLNSGSQILPDMYPVAAQNALVCGDYSIVNLLGKYTK